jgi:hypothetical protein
MFKHIRHNSKQTIGAHSVLVVLIILVLLTQSGVGLIA